MRVRDIIIWVLFVLAVIMAFWYVFGNSPTFEQAMLTLVITILFTISTKISDISSRLGLLGKRFTKLEDSFIRLTNDFKKVRKI